MIHKRQPSTSLWVESVQLYVGSHILFFKPGYLTIGVNVAFCGGSRKCNVFFRTSPNL